jgi:hypothetical protein
MAMVKQPEQQPENFYKQQDDLLASSDQRSPKTTQAVSG